MDTSTDNQKTIEEREKVREWIRERMEKSELPMEPELNLDSVPRAVKWAWREDKVVDAEIAEEEDGFFGDD